MIYIVNEVNNASNSDPNVATQNETLSLSVDADKTPEGKYQSASLRLCTASGEVFTIAKSYYHSICEAMVNRFKPDYSEVLIHNKSKHSFRVEGAKVYMMRDTKDTNPSHVKLVLYKDDEELPEKYVLAKDMIVVIHKDNDEVTMENCDLNGGGAIKVAPDTTKEEGEEGIACTIFVIKWYNWSTLRNQVAIMVNGEKKYELGVLPSRKVTGRMVNAIKSIRTTKKRVNKE